MKCLWEICEHLRWDGNTPVCIHGIIDRTSRHECNKFESIIERIRKNLTGTDLVFKIDPCPAPRMTRADRWKKRPIVLKYFAWKDELRRQCRENGYSLTPVLNIEFIIPMPPSWSEKKKAKMDGLPHMQRPDRDNMLKAFQDAFDGDDGFVWDGNTRKTWGKQGKIIVNTGKIVVG